MPLRIGASWVTSLIATDKGYHTDSLTLESFGRDVFSHSEWSREYVSIIMQSTMLPHWPVVKYE